MHNNVSHTRRQMIGSALGILGAGVLASTRLPSVFASTQALSEPAQALEQAERLRPDPTIGFPVELSTDLVIGNPFGGGHGGIDIWRADSTPGQPLVACVDGVLVVQEHEPQSGKQGNSWVIQDDNGDAYRYHHLQYFDPDLKLGDQVRRGQVIGTMGSTGNPRDDAPHLHFEVRRGGPIGSKEDPVPLLGLPIPGVTVY